MAPGGSGGGPCATPDYNTISAAVSAASSGDTVIVCPGTYSEQVTIDKSLTLQGSGASSTTILAPSSMSADGFGAVVILEITNGATVDFSGFTVSGPGPSSCGSIRAGVFVSEGATAYIHDNTVTDIRDNPASGCQNGVGILVGRNLYHTTGTATIVHNVIINYQKGGIVVDGLLDDTAHSFANILNNQIGGSAADAFTIAANSIQISRHANAVVNNNHVTGNQWCGSQAAGDVGTAILLFEAGASMSTTIILWGRLMLEYTLTHIHQT